MTISVRIVNLDHYMADPGPLDRSYTPFSDEKLCKVPVLRIFGSTNVGQKVCLHIHQVFPYFFVPYDIPIGYTTDEEVQKDIFQFGTSLNEAMDLARPQKKKNQHIAAIVLVKGVPFYGYHVGYKTYLKIYITNPNEKHQMLKILQSGAIQDISFQPHEAHLNFELQFLIDHNLYGMDWIHIEQHNISPSFKIQFRSPMLDEPKANYHRSQSSSDISTSSHFLISLNSPQQENFYTSKTVPLDLQSDAVPRSSYCELELDITGMSILNRHELKERSIHSSLKREKQVQASALNQPEEESKKKLVKSLESIWADETSRRRSRGIREPIPPVTQLDEREPRKPWSAEPALRRLMEKMMTGHAFDEVSETQQPSALIPQIMTVFEAIEALYPDEYFVYQQSQHILDHPASSPVEKQHTLEFTSSPTNRVESTPACTPPSYILNSNPRHFNVSATPSRYRTLDVQSQLNTSIIHSFIEGINSSLYQVDEGELPHHGDESNDDDFVEENDEFELSNEDNLRNSDIARWLEETEREEVEARLKRRKTRVIAYEGDESITYEPRKLDFKAEADRIDTILKTEHTHKTRKEVLNFAEEEEDIEDDFKNQDNDKGKGKGKGKEDKRGSESFTISDIPPEPMPRVKRSQRKRNIDQLDGSGDNEERRKDWPKTPAERWEDEKRSLKKIWRKKSAINKSLKKEEKRSLSTPPTLDDKLTKKSSELQRAKSDESLHPKGFQKVVVKIRKRIPKKRKNPAPKVEDISIEMPLTKELTTSTAKIVEKEKRDVEHNGLVEADDAVYQLEENDNEEATSTHFTKKTEEMCLSQEAVCSSEQNRFFLKDTATIHPPMFDISQYSAIQTQTEKTVGEEVMRAIRSDAGHDMMGTKEFVYPSIPPRIHQGNLSQEGVVYQEPFYSNPSDVPRFPTIFAGKEFKLPTVGLPALKEFKSVYGNESTAISKEQITIKTWTPTKNPPSFTKVQDWMRTEAFRKPTKTIKKDSKTQLNQPTMSNTFNFKFSASKPVSKVKRIRDYIDYFSLEIHVNTRDQLLPDPQYDAVQLVFWCLQTEDLRIPSNGYQEGFYVGVIAMKDFDISRIGICNSRLAVDYADTEERLFSLLIERIRYYDPDMLVGYEVQNASWGYLVDRGVQLGYHLLDELSRVITTSESIIRDQWGYQKASVYKVTGRHVLNVWRLMRNELTLTSYTFENVAYNLLHDRVPHYSHATLTSWYTKGLAVLKYRLFKYYMKRVQLNLDMLDASQVVSRTCESARVYGIDFYAVISRGSQYNVESVMFRIAKPENYVLITPSRSQVASQRSLEILPLIMEPISQFYSSPMVVLDFQSLYPSIMIAYNYCYSTCLGRIRKSDETSRFGVLPSFEPDDGLLDILKDYINVSPNGIMFVKPEIRKSLLAKMLSELLDTRVMVKRAMKDYKEDPGLLRMLDAKQLTLKLLANVTYGYTSASFSGRMPSVEIADSIVASGRETLERSIKLINETEKWGARVVYGDTDSMFIYFPGKTKDEAFVLGNDIAETVTKLNPAPVKLKFEKVYHPAVLLAKKRYVGFKYENPSDETPVFEAKGIETVRRDGTAATQKVLESCLKILFRTQDMSELKAFLYDEWTKILSNRVLLQDFIISKEVRMGTYSSRGGPNGALIAQAQMDVDPRAEPQYGERVPYVVVYRGPHAKLKDKVVQPEELLNDSSLRLDAEYYIRKQIIPPLSRVFNLMGVDILSMYESMPRSQKAAAMNSALNTTNQAKSLTRIDQYYASSHCIVCRKLADQVICKQCKEDTSSTIFTMLSRQQISQDKFRKLLQVCQDCSNVSPLDAMTVMEQEQEYADIPCNSLDCPIFYERLKGKEDVRVTDTYNALIQNFYDPQI
ncbi:hypothetical protein [Parasitella parasitica]|uniref:DNA polymerase n=1 Tax=Parasitella parasitica TaxID=35722 RepID=A0A0B7NU19_9FUNG|nr:hypothetical protein [Parasitella parasitica]